MPREVVLVGVVAALVGALYAWAATYNVDTIDEAYFVDLALRVTRGELPYRDFDTYYTPAVFYVLAGAFHLAGVSLLPVRLLMTLVRLACGLLLYRLGRRVMPWPFAVLPVLALAVADPVPLVFDPHPGWLALLGTLAVLELGCLALGRGQRRWLIAAGAAVGLAFASKQNVGAFAGIAITTLILLRPADARVTGWVPRAAQLAWALLLLGVARLFLHASWASLVGVVLWWPLAGALAIGVWVAWRPGPPRDWWTGTREILLDALAVALGGGVATLVWLVPLVRALGPGSTPFGLFVGQVNQGALGEALPLPPEATRGLGLLAIWLPVGLSLLAWPTANRGQARWIALLIGVVASFALLLVPAEDPGVPALAQFPIANRLDAAFGTLLLFLAPASAWAAIFVQAAMLAAKRPPRATVVWLTLGGACAALAFYPRFDVPHAALAGAPMLILGAWVLSRVHLQLSVGQGRVRRALLFATLVPLLAAACAPHLYWRGLGTAFSDLDRAEPAQYVPLGLARAPVLVPAATAAALVDTVRYLEAETEPGEPVFAYPVDSLVNFLADRPNPTRFTHLMAGALRPEDELAVVADLERARPRIVVVDPGAVWIWDTVAAYPRLTAYLQDCYRAERTFGPFEIRRRVC